MTYVPQLVMIEERIVQGAVAGTGGKDARVRLEEVFFKGYVVGGSLSADPSYPSL